MSKPIFDWSRVMFVSQGEKVWTREEAAQIATRVEEIYRAERERDRNPMRWRKGETPYRGPLRLVPPAR